ncbi:hypothetical protein M514_09001 [Trichuris suis]|uniref:Uncharacterized protein n=1 Tax=Trichuris suis TaxID=68888 RepID=A0A085NKP6_9BILA|nr:hypothetical protein M513_09001 [Trichuris suis]KFD70042.1 hypothetical protein M514_09001 [Trichuris suis]
MPFVEASRECCRKKSCDCPVSKKTVSSRTFRRFIWLRKRLKSTAEANTTTTGFEGVISTFDWLSPFPSGARFEHFKRLQGGRMLTGNQHGQKAPIELSQQGEQCFGQKLRTGQQRNFSRRAGFPLAGNGNERLEKATIFGEKGFHRGVADVFLASDESKDVVERYGNVLRVKSQTATPQSEHCISSFNR